MKKIVTLLLSLALVLALTAAAQKSEPLIYNEQKTSILVTADHPEFSIKLKSNPTTGYSWFLRECNQRYIEPLKQSYQAPENKKLMGAPGYEIWTFRVKPEAFTVPHQKPLRFVYARPWEQNDHSTSLVFWVSTKRKD
jgi:inhibitor of cysteine peptidase